MTGLAAALGLDPAALAELRDDLRRRHQTVAVAESLTGGLVCAALTAVPGSSEVVRGGLVVYATPLKALLAGVDPDLLAAVGAVHPDVARGLATGARQRLEASWGVGITGVAGPDQQDGRAVGTVFCAVAGSHDTVESAAVHPGARDAVRAAAVRQAVELLILAVRREHLSGTAR